MNSGDKFNMLKCLEYVDTDKRGRKFLFLCDCGNTSVFHGTYVKSGRYKSCGCLKYQKNRDSDIIGKQYHYLTPIKRVENIRGGKQFTCLCKCGKEVDVALSNLKRGSTKSCGCWNSEVQSKFMRDFSTIHGKSKTPEYKIWKGMKERCSNKNSSQYQDYGGRGIKVCKEWNSSFEAFIFDMGERPTDEHQIDRKDNDKGYSPDNCHWVLRSENAINKRHKLSASGYRNIVKRDDYYYVHIKRKGITRNSRYSSLDICFKLKELYLSEYEKDPEEWLKRTKDRNYEGAPVKQ